VGFVDIWYDHKVCSLLHGEVSPLTLTVFDVRGLFAETGRGNQSPLVAFDMLGWNKLETC